MSKYTLNVSGRPIEEAMTALEATEGIKMGARTMSRFDHDDPGSAQQVALSVVVDAPSLSEAEKLVRAALPQHGAYTVGRPDPLEDDEGG